MAALLGRDGLHHGGEVKVLVGDEEIGEDSGHALVQQVAALLVEKGADPRLGSLQRVHQPGEEVEEAPASSSAMIYQIYALKEDIKGLA